LRHLIENVNCGQYVEEGVTTGFFRLMEVLTHQLVDLDSVMLSLLRSYPFASNSEVFILTICE
jgi:hypothetical protein